MELEEQRQFITAETDRYFQNCCVQIAAKFKFNLVFASFLENKQISSMGDRRLAFLVDNIASLCQVEDKSNLESKIERSEDVRDFFDDVR